MILNPNNLWRGEPRQSFITGDLYEALSADPGSDLVALIGAALVVPKDRGSEGVLPLIQKNEAVHLSSQTNSRNRFAGNLRLQQTLADACSGRLPPVFRLLLGPERMGG